MLSLLGAKSMSSGRDTRQQSRLQLNELASSKICTYTTWQCRQVHAFLRELENSKSYSKALWQITVYHGTMQKGLSMLPSFWIMLLVSYLRNLLRYLAPWQRMSQLIVKVLQHCKMFLEQHLKLTARLWQRQWRLGAAGAGKALERVHSLGEEQSSENGQCCTFPAGQSCL